MLPSDGEPFPDVKAVRTIRKRRGAAAPTHAARVAATTALGMIANWVCFVKLLRIDHPVTVYIGVDVDSGWCRDPFACPYRLEALQFVEGSKDGPQ